MSYRACSLVLLAGIILAQRSSSQQPSRLLPRNEPMQHSSELALQSTISINQTNHAGAVEEGLRYTGYFQFERGKIS